MRPSHRAISLVADANHEKINRNPSVFLYYHVEECIFTVDFINKTC